MSDKMLKAINAIESQLDEARNGIHNSQYWCDEPSNSDKTYDELLDEVFAKARAIAKEL